MDYFEIGMSLAGQGVYNDPPQDITRAANAVEPKAHEWMSDRESQMWQEIERLQESCSAGHVPASTQNRIDWCLGQIEQIQDAQLLASFKRAVGR